MKASLCLEGSAVRMNFSKGEGRFFRKNRIFFR